MAGGRGGAAASHGVHGRLQLGPQPAAEEGHQHEPLSLGRCAPPSMHTAQLIVQASMQAAAAQPELQGLQQALHEHLHANVFKGVNVPPPVSSAAALAAVGLQDTITVVPGACLVGVPEWAGPGDSGLLQVVRATPSFYGRQRFDFVSLRAEGAQVRWHAHLRLLFTAISRAAEKPGEYALIQWYERAPLPRGRTDVLHTEGGCPRIRAQLHRGEAWYQVVPLDTLLSRAYVVPKHDEPGVLHVSALMPL